MFGTILHDRGEPNNLSFNLYWPRNEFEWPNLILVRAYGEKHISLQSNLAYNIMKCLHYHLRSHPFPSLSLAYLQGEVIPITRSSKQEKWTPRHLSLLSSENQLPVLFLEKIKQECYSPVSWDFLQFTFNSSFMGVTPFSDPGNSLVLRTRKGSSGHLRAVVGVGTHDCAETQWNPLGFLTEIRKK